MTIQILLRVQFGFYVTYTAILASSHRVTDQLHYCDWILAQQLVCLLFMECYRNSYNYLFVVHFCLFVTFLFACLFTCLFVYGWYLAKFSSIPWRPFLECYYSQRSCDCKHLHIGVSLHVYKVWYFYEKMQDMLDIQD